MNAAFIPTKDDLQKAIREAVRLEIMDSLPELIHEATAKPWLTKEELMDLTSWSSRTIQNLRDTRQIPFSQHGHKILYPRKGIMEFLESNHLKPWR